MRRTPRMLAEVFGDGLGEAVPESQGLIFVAIVALFSVIVIMALGGALAVLNEVFFG